MQKWSEHLCRQFDVVLPEDVARWYDEEVWRQYAGVRYGEPIPPEAILEATSHAIWGGLMLPDTLPILDNGCGDVLAMRFSSGGTLTEFVEWHHESMGWHPCGKSLVDTLFYDAARTSFEEEDQGPEGTDDEEVFRFAEWAFCQRRSLQPADSFKEFIGRHSDDDRPIAALLSHGVAEPAVWRDLARAAVTNGLERSCLRMSGQNIAEAAGTTWEQLSKWVPDASAMPEELKAQVAKVTNLTVEELVAQDVDAAAAAAEGALRSRSDLIWPYAVAGWADEKRGRQEAATRIYRRGLEALSSTTDFTEGWVPPGPDRALWISA